MMNRFVHGGLFVLWLLLSGCVGDDGPRTYPVRGTVTMDGKPVAGATVSFIPEEGGASAVGVTDESGKYELTTRRKGDGAVVGRYKVTVAKYEAQYESSAGSSETHADYDISDEYPDGYDEYAETQKAEKAKAENALPEKYASPRNTPFTAEVKEGENVFDFALEK